MKDISPKRQSLSANDIDGLIGLVAELVGVRLEQLKHKRTIDRARPYRNAIWYILAKDYGMSTRTMAKHFHASRNSIQEGLRRVRDGDGAHRIALNMVRAKIRRMEIGI